MYQPPATHTAAAHKPAGTLALPGPVGSSAANPVSGIIHHGNKAYLEIAAGEWRGCEEITVKKTPPTTRWTGGRIPHVLWENILSFFEWSMEETKSETMVQLMYHREERRWDALVLPQEGYQGMTVQLLPDHPNRIPTYARLGRGWRPMGSVHHHCTASAFQSGTDRADEETKEGIHLTVGNITHARYSLHSRTSFRELMFDAVLSDWFEPAEPAIMEAIPAKLHDEVLLWQLTTPPPKESRTFPDWWKENVIKVERITHTRTTKWGRRSTDHPYQQYLNQHTPPVKHEGPTAAFRVKWFLEDLADLNNLQCGIELPEIWEALNTLTSPLFSDLLDILDRRELIPDEGVEHLLESLEKGTFPGWKLGVADAEGNRPVEPDPEAEEGETVDGAGITTGLHSLSDAQYAQAEEAEALDALAAWRAEQAAHDAAYDQR